MPVTPPFSPFVPTSDALPENLMPHPPADIPEAPEAGDATASAPEAPGEQDIDSIIASLTLDRPLPLYIPGREKYKDKSFHIINDDPQEYAAAARQYWKPVTDPYLLSLFEGKVSGVDKTGKIRRPVLMERPLRITEAYDKLKRQKLHDMYQGLDPRNKQFNSKYADTEAVINSGATKGSFSGAGWRIKV
jgi:hypothetical protein